MREIKFRAWDKLNYRFLSMPLVGIDFENDCVNSYEIEQIADIIGVMHEGKLIKELEMAKLNKSKRKYTEFAVSNTKLASKLLQERYQIKNFDIVENTIMIADCTHDTGEINKAFVESGLLVTRVHSYEESLENYFSNLIGGKGIA